MAKKKRDESQVRRKIKDIKDEPLTTYVLQEGFNVKQETKKTNEEPPEWFKPIAEIKEKPEKYTTFALWQAAAIAHAASELANWIETVGDKKSTLNKIDALRRAIVYTNSNKIYPFLQDGQANLKLIEFNDLLVKILDEILPYYKSVNKKPVPAETVENLKRLTEQLQQYASEYNEHVPLETATNEMRQLADDIPHYNYPDICLTGKATGISFLLGAIVCDLYKTKQLTEDEIQAKSYLSQSMNLLNEFSAKRSWPKDEKEQQQFKTKISEDIIHFANQLDKNPVVKQYQDVSRILSNEGNIILTNNIIPNTDFSETEKQNKRKSNSKNKQREKEQDYKIPKNYINQEAYNEGRRARLAKYYDPGKSPEIEKNIIYEFQFEQALVTLKAMIESYNEIDIDWGMDDEAWDNKRIIEETAAKYRGAGSQLPTPGFGDICIRTAENAVRNYAELSHTYYDVCELSNQVKQTKYIQQIQTILSEMSGYLSYLDFKLYRLLEDGHKKEVLEFVRDIVQKLYEQVGKRLKHCVARYKICDYLQSYKGHSQESNIGEKSKQRADSDKPEVQAELKQDTQSGSSEENEKKQNKQNWHNEDFTVVIWNDTEYKFDTPQQALSVKYLWENKRAREKSIGEAIKSDNNDFRLIHVFRLKGKNGEKHPAWGKMIIKDGNGIYTLADKNISQK